MPTTVFNHLFENLDKGAGPELLRSTSEPKKLHSVPGCQKDSGQRRKTIHLRKFIILRDFSGSRVNDIAHVQAVEILVKSPTIGIVSVPNHHSAKQSFQLVPMSLPVRFFHGTCTAEPPPVCHDVANLDFPMRSVLFEFSLKINGFT